MTPEFIGGTGVPGVGQCLPIFGHYITYCGNGVVDLDRLDSVPVDGKFLLSPDSFEGQDRVLGAGNFGEIGPDDPIEQMVPHGIDDVIGAVDRDRVAQVFDDDVVGQGGNATDMIEVGMGNQDVADPPLLVLG